MDAKEYLTDLYYLYSKIQENIERISYLKEQADKITSTPSLEKVQSSNLTNKIIDSVCMWVDLEKQIKEDEAKAKAIEETIELLKPYEKTVLYKRYKWDMSLNEIARDIHRSYSWVSKKHRTGIKKIQAILDKREVRV